MRGVNPFDRNIHDPPLSLLIPCRSPWPHPRMHPHLAAAIHSNTMIRGVALVILGLVVSCAGFTLPPTARRWPPNARRRALNNRKCRSPTAAATAAAQMSIREMIGADVESGGLFDPLGKRERGEERCFEDDGSNETLCRSTIAGCACPGHSKVGFMSKEETSSNMTGGTAIARGLMALVYYFSATPYWSKVLNNNRACFAHGSFGLYRRCTHRTLCSKGVPDPAATARRSTLLVERTVFPTCTNGRNTARGCIPNNVFSCRFSKALVYTGQSCVIVLLISSGFSKDEPSLFRRRAVELKHGRVRDTGGAGGARSAGRQERREINRCR